MTTNSLLNFIIALLCIISGIALIYLYEVKIKRQKSQGTWDFKIRTGGIGLVMVGIGLILREFDICC